MKTGDERIREIPKELVPSARPEIRNVLQLLKLVSETVNENGWFWRDGKLVIPNHTGKSLLGWESLPREGSNLGSDLAPG